VSSFLLPAPWSTFIPAGQAIFYVTGLAGWLLNRAGVRMSAAYFAYYFLVIHLAGLLGLWAVLRRSDQPYWEPRK
jgi:hypothetical protein